MEVGLWCPQCAERVAEPEKYTEGQQQRATCPQCHAELVRDAEVEVNTWKVEQPTPLELSFSQPPIVLIRRIVSCRSGRSLTSGRNCFGSRRRDIGHSRLPEPPHSTTGWSLRFMRPF